MPSAKTARPSPDSTRPGSAKRARLATSASAKATPADELPAQLGSSTAACKVPKFLRSLYAILQTEDPQVISWVQNRELKPNSVTAFHILEMERFEREVLPKYFKHQKFASFQRQLNNFGFRKWTKTQSSGVCTFSHNSFPPDLSAPSNPNMSIREQWRQKSTQVIPPPTSAMGQSMKRRVVGNGIAKTKQQQAASAAPSRRRPANVQVHARDMGDLSPFAELYRSPNSNASMESSGFRHSLSHQPALKKLARPNVSIKQDATESLNGLEAFCDDSFKFILPPLQPHHLLSATPRHAAPPASLTPSFSNRSDSSSAPALGGFRYPLTQVISNSSTPTTYSAETGLTGNGYKSLELKHADTQPHPFPPVTGHSSNSANGAADAAALQGAFLEPWMWDAQTSASNFELSSFPLEFDCKNEFDWQESSSNGHGAAVMPASSAAMSSVLSTKELCHQQDRGVPSTTEEFGLENLLFAE